MQSSRAKRKATLSASLSKIQRIHAEVNNITEYPEEFFDDEPREWTHKRRNRNSVHILEVLFRLRQQLKHSLDILEAWNTVRTTIHIHYIA